MILPFFILVFSFFTLIPTIIVIIYSAINWKKPHHFFLAGLFISIIFYYLPFLLSNAKLLRYLPYTFKSGIIFYFMIPGFLNLYLKSFLTRSFYLRKKHLIYLIGPFIAFLDYLVFHIQNNSRIDELTQLIENNSMYFIRLEGFIPFEINLLLRFLYILPFAFYIIKLTIQQSEKPFLTKEDKKTFVFIKYLLFALLYAYYNFFAALILPLLADKIDFSDTINSGMLILAGAVILYISFSILLSPELLFDVKERQKKNTRIKAESFEESLSVITDIEIKMNEHKFYLNENFSSQDVLTHFELPRNKLDELLVQVKGITFAEWLNSFRIDYAKSLLISNKEFTIDALSAMSGFSSRSAFYAAFKHFTKTTPTDFIRQWHSRAEKS